jgi:hypothetical protein
MHASPNRCWWSLGPPRTAATALLSGDHGARRADRLSYRVRVLSAAFPYSSAARQQYQATTER